MKDHANICSERSYFIVKYLYNVSYWLCLVVRYNQINLSQTFPVQPVKKSECFCVKDIPRHGKLKK